MARNYSSVVEPKTLTSVVSSVATQITLNNVTGLPSPPYVLILNPDTAKEEAVLVTVDQTGVTSPTLKVQRAIEANGGAGVAQEHTFGDVVKHMIVGSDLQIVHDHFSNDNPTTGTAHGATGGVVGRTNSQTLTNKTIDLTDNILRGTKAEFNASLEDADFATIAGTETLTGKTLTTPKINEAVNLTATSTELNVLDGITADTAELNKLDGVTATTAELNGLSGRTASRAIVTNASGILTAAVTTDTEIARLSGLSSNVQDQLNSKAPTANPTFTGTITGNLSGNVTGNVTGNVSGSSGSCTGNSATSSSTTGNAATATALQTARTINGVSFNGTASIKTHAGGTGTAPSSSYDRVYHGLGVAPSSYSVTQRSSGVTGSPRIFYITNVQATYFDVYSLDTAGNAATGAFYWTAVV